jgi:hypothetical protein
MGLLLARTDPDAGRQAGLTAFVVPMSTPGVTVRPIREMMCDDLVALARAARLHAGTAPAHDAPARGLKQPAAGLLIVKQGVSLPHHRVGRALSLPSSESTCSMLGC